MKILIAGYYGFSNLGDEVILSSMVRDIRRRLGPVELTVTSGNPSQTEGHHGVAAVHWRDVPALAETVAGADAVVLGGGGLFHHLWGFAGETLLTPDHWGIPFFAGPAVLAALHDTPLVLYAVGVEEISDPGAGEMTRAVFELAWGATVRDGVSAGFVRELGVDDGRFTVTADPAWAWPAAPPPPEGTVDPGGGHDGPVGVALRFWDRGVDPEGWLTETAAALERFATAHGTRLLLVPFQALEAEEGYDDRAVATELARRLSDPSLAGIVPPPADGAAAVELFSRCRLVLGMRYHALLLAARAGTPAVALAYAPKVRGLAEQLGAGELCLPVEAVERETLEELLERAWAGGEAIRKRLSARAAGLGELARRNVELLAEAVAGRLSRPELTPAARALVASASLGAVVRAARRTAEVVDLVTERQWRERIREAAERERDEARRQRDEATRERDEATRERDETMARAASLEERLAELESRHGELEQAHAELLQGHQALETSYRQLEAVHGRIVSSRLFRMVSTVWRLREDVARLPGRIRRHLAPWRDEVARRPESWQGFAFERFRRAMVSSFGPALRRVLPGGEIGHVSVLVLAGDRTGGLRETLVALARQDFARLQVLVAVTGEEAAREVQALAGRAGLEAETVEAPGPGLPELLQAALPRIRGDAVLWLEPGDLPHSRAIGTLARALEASSRCDGVCAAFGDPPGGAGADRTVTPLSRFNLDPRRSTSPWACLVRSEALHLVGPPGELVGALGSSDLLMRLNEAVRLGSLESADALFSRHGPAEGRRRAPEEERGAVAAMAVFDDFRRNLFQGHVLWEITGEGPLAEALGRGAAASGDPVRGDRARETGLAPRPWLPSLKVYVGSGPAGGELVVREEAPPGTGAGERWDLQAAVEAASGPAEQEPPGSWRVAGVDEAVRLLRLLALERHTVRFESFALEPAGGPLEASVILCTHRPIPPLEAALASLAAQDLDPERFEVVLVNNDPGGAALRETLDAVLSRHFGEGSPPVRRVACPVPGLSHARNAGIAAARGEILLFLDDDAVAPPGWVRRAVSLFREHPGYGVVGGYIRLVPPDPKPPVLHPGWERYWSQYVGEATEPFTVTDWWDYPWGASWCARRSVLLAIGGFRTGYGRTGKDFAGGEEVVAAALAARLGWEIAVDPGLEVEHRVIAERFTWEHVRRTILAGTLGNYRMQRDLYIPMDGPDWTLRCLLDPGVDRTVEARTVLARLRHWSYRKRAWARLLAWQLRDLRELRRLERAPRGC